nr:immunoglobulin light chain junction region [Macaca mulatta]
CQHYSDRPYSF